MFAALTLGQKFGAALALVVVLSGIVWKIRHDGVEAGKAEGTQTANQQVAESDYKNLVARLDAFEKEKKTHEANDARLEGEKQQAQRNADTERRRAENLKTQLEDARRQVHDIPDSALFSDIRGKLGILPSSSTEPHFVPRELRQIDLAVTDAPKLKETVESQGKRLTSLEESQKKTDEQLRGVRDQLAKTEKHSQEILTHYTTVFNLVPRKKKAWKCLKIWMCGKADPISAPSPESLKPATL